MQTAKNKGVKVALSSIFWSSFKRAMHEGGSPGKKAELIARHLGKLLFPYLPTGRRRTMALSDIIFPNSEMEKDQLVRLFGMQEHKIRVVPNGIDRKFFDADPGLFSDKFKLKGFVLAVGRIEPRKNQLNLIRALTGSNKKLVIIGDPVSDYTDYHERCRKEAGENVVFLNGIKHGDELLASAYASCGVFAAPGWFETPGLAALEAAAAGAGIAITRYGCTEEYFRECAAYFDPSDAGDINKAVIKAAYIDAGKKEELKKHIRENYLWENVALETLNGYKSIIKGDI
jgi:glycosyltransferase involved in cell wall biosynthesis